LKKIVALKSLTFQRKSLSFLIASNAQAKANLHYESMDYVTY
jgi:hypothetical protein